MAYFPRPSTAGRSLHLVVANKDAEGRIKPSAYSIGASAGALAGPLVLRELPSSPNHVLRDLLGCPSSVLRGLCDSPARTVLRGVVHGPARVPPDRNTLRELHLAPVELQVMLEGVEREELHAEHPALGVRVQVYALGEVQGVCHVALA